MTTANGNKLIALFHHADDFGWVIAENNDHPKRGELYVEKGKLYLAVLSHSHTLDVIRQELNYHEDWNLLMRVLDKCFNSTTEEQRQFEGLTLFEIGLFTPIEEVWDAVIEFVQWYNKSN